MTGQRGPYIRPRQQYRIYQPSAALPPDDSFTRPETHHNHRSPSFGSRMQGSDPPARVMIKTRNATT
jgi:hypothetical protein